MTSINRQNLDNGSTKDAIKDEIINNFVENNASQDKNCKNQADNCKNEHFSSDNNNTFCTVSDSIVDPVSNLEPTLSVENSQAKHDNSSQDDENEQFAKLFPGISRNNIENDRVFNIFKASRDASKSFCDVYSDYLEIVGEITKEIKAKEAFKSKTCLSAVGPLSSSERSDDCFFTKEQVLRMSKEQIAKNYEKIRKSQQKW